MKPEYHFNKTYFILKHSVPLNLMSHEKGLDDRKIVETIRAELMRERLHCSSVFSNKYVYCLRKQHKTEALGKYNNKTQSHKCKV